MGGDVSYVVVGFYTPNYAEIAAELRRSLETHAIPHKLYPVDMLGGTWLAQTLRKPYIVQKAFTDFPGRSVIFMDVDCTVHGDLAPLVSQPCDAALRFRKGATSTQVVVFHRTPAAEALLECWRSKCDAAIEAIMAQRRIRSPWKRSLGVSNDEHLLQHALIETPVMIRVLPKDCFGLVTHESAHDRLQPDTMALKLKRFRRQLKAPLVRWLTPDRI